VTSAGRLKAICLTQVSFGTHSSLVKTIKISEAKRNFSRIFARAKRGETIILQNGDDYMQLIPCALPDPVPLYPVGTFYHTDDEVAMINDAPADAGPLRQ
jgi:hypothetical protein